MDAVLTAHVSWLNQLLGRFKCDVSRWLIAAAAKGHRNVVNRLLVPPRNWKEPPNTVVSRAAVVAGGAGHLEMTALLLNQNDLNFISLRNDIERNYAHTTARTVLSTAAANGHLNVVQYMVQRPQEKEDDNKRSAALARAITGRHTVVVEYLILLQHSSLDLVLAFAVAVDTNQLLLAKRVFDAYRKKTGGTKMFVKLAEGGHLSAVKYLYDRGSLFAPVNPAFLSAATYGKTNVVEILLNTGLITAESLDNAFKTAAELVGAVHFDTVIFLYKTRRAFLNTTNKAHERISDKAIISAFEKVTEGEESNINYDTRYQSEIIKLMSEELCIPTEMICKAFVTAASNGKLEVVEHLYDDHRISAEAMGKSFVGVACNNHVDMMTSLYDGQRISPMAAPKAFNKATERVCIS